jgi:hypothetical protein
MGQRIGGCPTAAILKPPDKTARHAVASMLRSPNTAPDPSGLVGDAASTGLCARRGLH